MIELDRLLWIEVDRSPTLAPAAISLDILFVLRVILEIEIGHLTVHPNSTAVSITHNSKSKTNMVRFFPAAAMSSSSEDSSLQLQQIAADCLVIAVPSTGQVSQLALDLMVSSATTNSAAAAPRVQLLGWLDSENHVAMVGTEQFDRRPDGRPRPQLCLPLELYGLGTAADDKGNCSSSERRWRLALLQTRAPLLRGHAAAYVEELVAWVKSCPFGRVVLVAGAAPTAEEMLDPAARLWFSRNSHAQVRRCTWSD